MIEYISEGKVSAATLMSLEVGPGDFDALYADGGCPVTLLNARLKFDALLNPHAVAT